MFNLNLYDMLIQGFDNEIRFGATMEGRDKPKPVFITVAYFDPETEENNSVHIPVNEVDEVIEYFQMIKKMM